MTATVTNPLDTTIDNPEARSLMQSAYENRYTWDEHFPGYTAQITVTTGDQTYRGKVKVNANLSVETDIEDSAIKKEVLGQLQEIAIHRVRRSFADTHGKNTFNFGETDATGAVELIVGGKSAGDRYKIRHNEVCMVHRHIHGIVVTIDTQSSHQTPEGYLSHQYHSIYRDPQTGEVKNESNYTDNYTQVGKYHILTDRTITSLLDNPPRTITFQFSDIQLLG
jgi:hypothetical protein